MDDLRVVDETVDEGYDTVAPRLNRLFRGAERAHAGEPREVGPITAPACSVRAVAGDLAAAKRPVLFVGSQAMLRPAEAAELAAAVDKLGIPVYLSGMARGLLTAGLPSPLRD